MPPARGHREPPRGMRGGALYVKGGPRGRRVFVPAVSRHGGHRPQGVGGHARGPKAARGGQCPAKGDRLTRRGACGGLPCTSTGARGSAVGVSVLYIFAGLPGTGKTTLA